MSHYLFELGNHPDLSEAEITAVLAPKTASRHGSLLIVESADFDAPTLMNRLGGTKKIAKQINIDPIDFLDSVQGVGKIQFSLSGKNAKKEGLSMKKALKARGRSVRFIEANNTATILHNNLVEKQGDLTKIGAAYYVTEAIQPIEDLSKRDYGRPGRDHKSGMLPPKLAQMLINLTGAKTDAVLLDPYCGSGTILTEALLMGFTNLIGTDLSERAISDTKENVAWAASTFGSDTSAVRVEQQDARTIHTLLDAGSVDAICFEPYMGKPLHGNERKDTLEKQMTELKSLFAHAFASMQKVLKPGGVIIGIIPQFFVNNEWLVIDCLEEIKRAGLQPTPLLGSELSLLYHREGQHVGRMIWKFVKG